MKILIFISLFSLSVHGQKTNEPTIVYPLLEQFISEAYNRDIPVYHKIREIDSIQTALLKYPISGLHLRNGEDHWIYLHKNRTGRSMEKTFYHQAYSGIFSQIQLTP